MRYLIAVPGPQGPILGYVDDADPWTALMKAQHRCGPRVGIVPFEAPDVTEQMKAQALNLTFALEAT